MSLSIKGIQKVCASAFFPQVVTSMSLIQTAFHLSFRLELLESQLSQLEQFDQALLTLTQSSEHFLSGLRSSSQVDIADLESAISQLKVRNQYVVVNNDVLYRFCILDLLR